MKAKYIILSLIASLAVLVGCQKEGPHYLNEIQVSSSYVSVPLAGGSTTITLNTTGAWSITGMPACLAGSLPGFRQRRPDHGHFHRSFQPGRPQG